MSAMEGINGQPEPVANGTSNGTTNGTNTATDPAPAPTEKRQINIAQISSDLPNPSHCEIRGIITLLWPYSSLTKSLALNLAEPDVRLRGEKGQVKISFTGSLGKFVGTQGLGIDDQLVLSLEGAELVKTTPRDSRDVGWELKYARILRGKITSRPTGDVVLDHEAQEEVGAAPVMPIPVVAEVPSPPRSPPKNRVNIIQNDDGEWSSPAFIKRARLSYGSLMGNDFDNFIREDGSIPGKGRKKARFEPRKSGTWRYQSESRSPSPEPEKEDTVMAEPEKPKAQMSEMGCQTDDLPYDEAAVQEFFRRSQAIGHEARQDLQQHIVMDEGVQTMFDGDAAEMFSPAPVPFHQSSTTPFGNPPVPLFAQSQIPVQGSTTPFGDPPAQTTTPMEPLPEHYQSIVSPLAAKSKATVHEEGQWPSSLLESMGYRPTSSLSKSITSTSSLRQSEQHEAFSPVAPRRSQESSMRETQNHSSAALALEELSRINQAQQIEDAMIDYSNPSASVLEGSLTEVAPALSPPRQSIQRSMYPDPLDHHFVSPPRPSSGSKQASRQQSPQIQSSHGSMRQSPVRYPAERYSRERSGTPMQRGGTPANRGASPTDSIDLTGDSDEDDGHAEQYSEIGGSGEEDVIPGESIEDTKQRILEEAEMESDGGEGYEEDEENMTEIKIPSWRGQPSMIPKSSERVQDEDSNDERDMYEGGNSEDGDGDEDEKMSEPDFGNRGVLLNPRAQRLSPRLDQDEDVDEDGDGDAEDYYSDGEEPASLQQQYSDDEEEMLSQDETVVDPDLAVMPGSDSEQYYDDEEEEELEESEFEHDQDMYERYEGEEEDMGPAYGQSGSNSRGGSQPQSQQGPPEVIDLLSSDDDEPAPPNAAVAKSASPPASRPAATDAQQDDNDDGDEQLKVQADESMSEAEEEEIAEHQKEIYEEEKEIEEKYHEVGDLDHHSPTPPPVVVAEMVRDVRLREEAHEAMSDVDEGKEDATEIAKHEREVYEEEVEDEIRSQEGHEQERNSPMSPGEEEAESEIDREQSGYEDEDATADEITKPQDIIMTDGASESRQVTSSPARRLFKNHPANREASPLPDKIESVEPPAADDGAMADVEDFEVPKENFDKVASPATSAQRPIDPAILAEHDEDRPVPMGVSAEVQDEEVAKAHELADETHGDSLVEAAVAANTHRSESEEASEQAQIAMAAILAERDEDRPVQARQGAISGPSSSAMKAEEAQIALEDKLDQEMEEDLRESKDKELTGEAQHDLQMAEVVPPAKYDDRTEPPSELEKEIAQDMEMATRDNKDNGTVKADVEPGPRGDHEDVEMDGDIVDSDQELEAFSEGEDEQDGKEPTPAMVKAAIEPGPRGDPEDIEMDGEVVASDQELEAFSEAESDSELEEEKASPATVKSAVEPGPKGDPEDADMDGDIVESDNGLDADDADTHMASSPVKAVPAVIINDNAGVVVASDVEQEEDEDEDDYEDPSSQLFEEMSYIEQVEHTQTLEVVEEVEEVEESQQTVGSQFIVSSNTQNSAWAIQQSQHTLQSMEASVFSQVVQEATSFETVQASQPEVVMEPEVREAVPGIEEVMESVPLDVEAATEEPVQGIVTEHEDDTMAEDVEVAPTKHTRSHDKPRPTPTTPAQKPTTLEAKMQAEEQEEESSAMEVDEHPASQTRSHDKQTDVPKITIERSGSPAAHTRSHDAAGECVEDDKPTSKETKSKDVEMSTEEDEHPAPHTRSHDKRVGKLQDSDRSGSPAEHTRSHDAIAGHCVEDDESAKGLQGSTRRKSSSRKSTEQPSEQNTPSKAPARAVTPVVEIPVFSAIDNVEGTPPKRVTRSRRGTQESVKPTSPPKTRKRALTPVVEVEVPAASVEEVEAEPAQEEPTPAPEPAKRVTRSRQNTAEPETRSPPKTRKTRRKSLTPVVEVPASSTENVPVPEPPKRTARGRKASNASVTKAATPPRTRRMSLRSQASPDTTNMTEESGSVQLQAIDEEDDELPDPGAAAILEHEDSPVKTKARASVTSAPVPAGNTRAKRNASPELKSSGQPVLETPIKTRARALRSQSLSQGSAMTSSQLASGLAHETPNQTRDPAAEAFAEATSPAEPMTPANKSFGTTLGTPSTWATLTPSAVAAQITKTLRTQLPAYTPLKNIKNQLKKKVDIICVCVDTPVPAVKSKHTPHDYALKFFVTDSATLGTVKEVTAFHHFKKCLPEMRVGNVVLLRNFLVDGQNNGCLRSEKDSSWAVWRKEGEAPETKSDVPLEFEGGEDEHAEQLKVWWEEKVEAASKEKMKTLAQKAAGKK